MNPTLAAVAGTFCLFVAILVFLEGGRHIAARRQRRPEDGEAKGIGALDGAVFGLMGLLIAFTFSGGAQRFENRRQLVIREANAIETAYLRLDLLPESAQPELRKEFKDYVDTRLNFYENLTADPVAARRDLTFSQTLQQLIWSNAVAACKQPSTQGNSNAVTSLTLPAINEMIDITTDRTTALETHPPFMVYLVLAIMVLASSLLAGYSMGASKKRSAIHMFVFAFVLTMTLYVIGDLEFPRMGKIRVDSADRLLVEMRAGMK